MGCKWLVLFLFCRAAAGQAVKITYAGADWVFPGDGLPALNAPLGQLFGITLDPAGNPVVVDNDNCIVAKIRPDATVSVIAGNGFCGQTFLPSGDGGPATSAGIYSPYSATYDPAGNLYVSSYFQVRKIAPDGTISLFAGSSIFNFGISGDGGPANQALIYAFGGLASDTAGNIYLADSQNNRVRRIARDGTIATVAGNGVASFSGDGGPARAAGLSPNGLAFDSLGNLYVADTLNARVRKIGLDGIISTVASHVDAWSLAFDSAGALYIGARSIVYKLAPGAATPVVFAGNGQAGYAGDGSPATLARLSGNVSVAADRAGNLYIADSNCRVRKVGLNGIITTIAGNGNVRYSGEGVPALTASLNKPWGAAVDSIGDLYFSEPYGNRVRKASRGRDGVVRVTTVAGNGTPGLSADPGPAAQSVINFPLGVVTDAAGNLYFADNGNDRVRKVNPQNIVSTYAMVPQPVGLAMDRAGNLYVSSDDNFVRKVDPSGKITVYAGTGVRGSSGDGGPAMNARLDGASGLAMDASGNLYIAEEFTGRVRRISPAGIVSTVAGNGSFGSSGDGGPANRAALFYPSGVALDAASNLYISEFYSGSVRKVDNVGLISTFAIGPPIDQKGDGQAATKNTPSPSQLAVDPAGNLFITDGYFNRVREVLATPPTMQVSPAALAFPKVASGGAPLTQSIAITGSIAGLPISESIVGLPFNVSIQASGPGNWLTADTSVDFTPRIVTLTADPATLAPGSYTATITIKPASATPAVLTVSVSLTVGPAQSPQLAVDRQTVSFTLTQAAAARSETLQIANTGGQTLSYTASISTASGGNWLAVSPASGQAAPGKPAALIVTANPKGLAVGTYTGAVTVDAGGAGRQTVAVIMTISGNAQAVLLTQTGLSFTAVAQGGVIPPQFFGVINAGTDVMKWTSGTSVTAGPNWLQVSPTSGASDAAGVVPQVKVSVSPAGLAAGKYYGTVRVDAPGTANGSRVLTVFLSVLPAGTMVAASVQPSELVFYATPNAGPPGSQNLDLYNISATSRAFTSARSSGGFEVLTLPASGSLAPDRPTRVAVQPNAGFPAGTATGTLRFQFSDGTVQIVKITVISASGASGSRSPVLESPARAPSPGASCVPSQLVVSLNTLSQAFQVSAGWPVGLSVRAVDDCSNPLVAGAASVWAHFDNGEDDVTLTALGDGTWQGTWRPQSVNPNVTVTINARSGTLPIAQKTVSGAQSAANDRPYFTLNSIGSVFATPTPGVRPLAPGSFLAIYGARLGDYNADAGGPLPRQLANAQVFFNDLPAPMNHADGGQINVVVPSGVSLNTSVQVRIQRDDTLSEPVAVDVAASHTSVLQTAGNAYAVDTPISGGTPFQVTASAPASAGDTLTLYCTGLGATTPGVADGAVSPASPLATVAGVTAKIGVQNAAVAFAGLAPSYVGLYQLNLVVPSGVTAGAAVPLTITSGGQTSPAVNLAIR
jgi:uncharacterized protein (TIGR03437 family)